MRAFGNSIRKQQALLCWMSLLLISSCLSARKHDDRDDIVSEKKTENEAVQEEKQRTSGSPVLIPSSLVLGETELPVIRIESASEAAPLRFHIAICPQSLGPDEDPYQSPACIHQKTWNRSFPVIRIPDARQSIYVRECQAEEGEELCRDAVPLATNYPPMEDKDLSFMLERQQESERQIEELADASYKEMMDFQDTGAASPAVAKSLGNIRTMGPDVMAEVMKSDDFYEASQEAELTLTQALTEQEDTQKENSVMPEQEASSAPVSQNAAEPARSKSPDILLSIGGQVTLLLGAPLFMGGLAVWGTARQLASAGAEADPKTGKKAGWLYQMTNTQLEYIKKSVTDAFNVYTAPEENRLATDYEKNQARQSVINWLLIQKEDKEFNAFIEDINKRSLKDLKVEDQISVPSSLFDEQSWMDAEGLSGKAYSVSGRKTLIRTALEKYPLGELLDIAIKLSISSRIDSEGSEEEKISGGTKDDEKIREDLIIQIEERKITGQQFHGAESLFRRERALQELRVALDRPEVKGVRHDLYSQMIDQYVDNLDKQRGIEELRKKQQIPETVQGKDQIKLYLKQDQGLVDLSTHAWFERIVIWPLRDSFDFHYNSGQGSWFNPWAYRPGAYLNIQEYRRVQNVIVDVVEKQLEYVTKSIVKSSLITVNENLRNIQKTTEENLKGMNDSILETLNTTTKNTSSTVRSWGMMMTLAGTAFLASSVAMTSGSHLQLAGEDPESRFLRSLGQKRLRYRQLFREYQQQRASIGSYLKLPGTEEP
ncbi:MAG: hypothetical protein H6618_01590 [Deltaproteobacteria bacterium]|nr:hypothetical protein [Deltaproteobacteria bacterium]